jgi:biopolymer transport protein ExbD
MHGPSRGGTAANPNLTPLLDLVLQLIMFFMITIDLVQRDRMNPEVELPIAQKAMPLDRAGFHFLFLNMNNEGKLVGAAAGADTPSKLKVYMQREKEHMERDARAEGASGDLSVIIVLRAHKDAIYRDVFRLLRQCSDAGFTRWQLRVRSQ